MRLINTSDGTLQNFFNEPTPPYAILSHRWLEDEIDFQDFSCGDFSKGASLDKLRHATEEARRKGYTWLWVDTCCINKDSSAELSEAINSMYKWYQDSEECLAYLHDVHKIEGGDGESKYVLQNSEWFYRGWTLQELLAPTRVYFYDHDWECIGERSKLSAEISSITGIDRNKLYEQDYEAWDYKEPPVAEKMSWAAKRVTTRPEDQAYCLLGIFDVNMPLLYGEGKKAFIRLQEEIIKKSDDKSIFVWHMGKEDVSGLLAPEPAAFDGCGDIAFAGQRLADVEPEPFLMTNRGLSIELDITPWATDLYLAYLEHGEHRRKRDSSVRTNIRPVFIFVKRSHRKQFARVRYRGNDLRFEEEQVNELSQRPYKRRRLFFRQKFDIIEKDELTFESFHGFHLPREVYVNDPAIFFQNSFDIYDDQPCVFDKSFISAHRRHNELLITQDGGWGIAVIMDVASKLQGVDVILLGFDFDSRPVCILQNTRLHSVYRDQEHRQITSLDLIDDKFVWAEDGFNSKYVTMREIDDRVALRGTNTYDDFRATVNFTAGHPPVFLKMECESPASRRWTLYLILQK